MKVVNNGVRLRSGPGTEYPVVIEAIPVTSNIVQVDPVGAWIHVTVNGVDGWVANSYIDAKGVVEEYQYTLEELLPLFQDTFPYRILAAIGMQESGFRNFRVHRDGTGHGLFGLDDGGLLPDFERWSGLDIGRGATANIIPVIPQIEYAKQELTRLMHKYDSPYIAARIWHTGEGNWNSESGANYERVIKHWESQLFRD